MLWWWDDDAGYVVGMDSFLSYSHLCVEDEPAESVKSKARRCWIPLGGAAVGALLIGVGLHKSTGNWQTLWVTIGTTLLASGLITYFVEEAWKRELQEDAFRAVFGYLLPKALRSELDWMFTFKVIADPCRVVIRLSRTDMPEELRMDMALEVTAVNLTDETQKREKPPEFHVDEWRSQTGESQVTEIVVDHEAIPSTLTRHRYGVVRTGKSSLKFPPNGTKTIHYGSTQYKRDRDEFSEVLGYPAIDPTVTVVCPDGIVAKVDFGHREPPITDDGVTFSMRGALLPWQPIRVRWFYADDPDLGQVE